MNMTTETVTTWADGYGLWSAKVTLPGGYGPQAMDREVSRLRRKARNAIRREVLAREAGPVRIRVQVVAQGLDDMNVMHSITFGEVPA